MNDIEINKRLALKLGWKESQLMECRQSGSVFLRVGGRLFHYNDPKIYVPVAAKLLKTKPWQSVRGWYYKYTSVSSKICIRTSSSYAKAVAMSVIGDSK